MVKCRFLGRSCIEIITLKDHIIIDPNFIESPETGIEYIFLTHGHSDHFSEEKIELIKENFSEEDKDIKIYGTETIIEESELDIRKVKSQKKIKLKQTIVEPFEVECYKAEECYAYVLTIGDVKILHTADSAKFSDVLRNIKEKIDYCFVASYEDYFKDYLSFLLALNPKVTFPYHFERGDEETPKKLVKFLRENSVEASFLEIGAEFEF